MSDRKGDVTDKAIEQLDAEGYFDALSMRYTAWAVLINGRREAIEGYDTSVEAVEDVLEFWCEDENDVVITDKSGKEVILMHHDEEDGTIARVYYVGDGDTLEHAETYRSVYVIDPVSGRSKTVVTRL